MENLPNYTAGAFSVRNNFLNTIFLMYKILNSEHDEYEYLSVLFKATDIMGG